MKGNVIRLNIMHLNSVQMNSIGEVQSVSLKAGESTEDPVYPPTTYTLAANVSNGKVTATKNGTAISLPYVATEGDVIVLSVTPDEGYEFNGWLDGNKSNPRTVTMTGNVVLSASCVEIAKPTYTLSASVTNGKVSATRNGSAVNLPFTANEGDTIVLSVTPNDGYTFEGWNDGNTDNPRSITMNADKVLSAQCVEVVAPPVGNYIQFEDPAVEAICVANWSSDGIGLTEEDAAKVTSIGTKFKGNTNITSFNEFQYFTGVKKFEAQAFAGCSSLRSIRLHAGITEIERQTFMACTALSSINLEHISKIYKTAFYKCNLSGALSLPRLTYIAHAVFYNNNFTSVDDLGAITTITGYDNAGDSPIFAGNPVESIALPATLETIGWRAFYNNSTLQKIICRATTPPTLENINAFQNTNNCPIYVPDASLEAYKTAVNWSAYADRIHPLSEIEDYYVSDALLMHLDGINKGNVEGEWQDLVSGKTFVNHGAVAEADGWRFDGASSYMYSTNMESYGPGYGNRTFEIVAEFERENTTEVVYMGAGNGYAFGRYAGGKSILLGSNVGLPSLADDMTSGVRIVSAATTTEFQIVASKINGNNAQVGANNHFDGGVDFIYLGARSNGNHFKGIIHSIRIHNRILSEEEILYNQRIDNKRFNLGLDI